MSSNNELKYLSRQNLYSIITHLKRETDCLKTDLIRFKLLSNSYQKLFDKFNEQIVFNNDILDLKNNINLLNDFNKSEYFPKIVCIKLNQNDLNGLNSKSQTNVNKTNEDLIQKNFNENNLSDNEVSDNQSEGIDCDNNDIIESNDETIDGSIDENENQLSVNCSENLVKTKINENSLEIPFQPIVKNEIQTEDKSTKVLNGNQIEISNFRSLRNRNTVKINYNTISGESEDIGIEFNENSDNDVNYDSNEEQMNDSSDDIWDEYNLIVNKNANKLITGSDNIYKSNFKYCSEVFNNKNSLYNHKNRDLGKYKCEVDGCMFEGRYPKDLVNHNKSKHQTNDYKSIIRTRKDLKNYKKQLFVCDYKDCSAVFKYEYTLKRHKNIHLSKFKCNVKDCNHRAATLYHMKSHMETRHSNVRPFECSVKDCDKTFKTRGDFKRHQQINHKLFICHKIECNLEFNSKNDLENHMIRHLQIDVNTNRDKFDEIEVNQEITENNSSEEMTEFICDFNGCDLTFNSRFLLFKHKLKHTSNNGQKSVKYFPCNWKDCSKIFLNNKRLKEHLAIHNETHACDWNGCQYKAPSNSCLIIHKKSHSEDRPFICDINNCEKKFKNKINLNNHQLTQHPKHLEHISWIKCPESGCNFMTKCKTSFVRHKTLHTLPFHCTHCPKRFSKNIYLASHMAKHTGSTQYKWKCEWYGCDKMFSKRYVMLDHMNVHTAENVYPCDWPACDKTFLLKKSLQTHLDRHKGLSYYNCKLCEYHTTNTIRYKNHMKKHENSRNSLEEMSD